MDGGGGEDFWRLYTALVTTIARAKGKDGHPNFEANPITSYYDEIMQAARGSRWVVALTLASAVEGLADMLMPKGEKDPKRAAADLDSMRKHLEAWTANRA